MDRGLMRALVNRRSRLYVQWQRREADVGFIAKLDHRARAYEDGLEESVVHSTNALEADCAHELGDLWHRDREISARALSRTVSFSRAATLAASGFFSLARGPRFFGASPPSSPCPRCFRQVERWEVYRPSRRSNAPTSPGLVQASAFRRTSSLYSAENFRRIAFAMTSTFAGFIDVTAIS